ncbi:MULTISPECIES: hypothetical protein [unclassified Arcicella]|uniref:hypothetical protein n=1 Tax=unclassified Arcicella TaxID=2644986 RepID=UPI002857DA34|nr:MULTISPECIES: hypothetical protein [unclassified Arcicella]MDR6561903.1 hypothetical protein [Arcicella sp. BE51]MDR6814049.1 hypothetical protein [Arcicella sp. BE140]MDR6825244.1 hypothetical protein [Arcicella sp. BE139]
MRLLLVFLSIFLISCSDNKSLKDSQSIASDSVRMLTIDSVSTLTVYDLAGDWVNLKYLYSIQKTKSPKISQNEGEFSFITFRSDTAMFVYGFHEGIDMKVITEKPNNFFCVDYDNDTIRISVLNDTMIIANKGIREKYIKYQMGLPNETFSSRLLNKEIFSGNYQVVDSPKQSISFSEDGIVKGFLDFNSYLVQDDYIDAGCQFDLLHLRKNPDDRFEYTWSFSKDTLMIYNLDCKSYDTDLDRCVETKKGKLLYKLIKK